MKPVYPEVLTADNTLSISAVNNGDGTVTITIKENQEFLIQDVKISTTGRTDLSFTVPIPTTAGQVDTYHLRYSLNGRAINGFIPQKNSFYLVNVNDTNYNPNALPETDEVFDTKYDDMLVARVDIDDIGNINILSLINKNKIDFTAAQVTSNISPTTDGVIEQIPTLQIVNTPNFSRSVKIRASLEAEAFWSGASQSHSPAIYVEIDGVNRQSFLAHSSWTNSTTRGITSYLLKSHRYSRKITPKFYGTTAMTFNYVYFNIEVE